jgi:glycosidase
VLFRSISQIIKEDNVLILKFEDIQENTAGIWKDVYILDGTSVPDIAKKQAPVFSKWLDNAVLYSIKTRDYTKEGNLSTIVRKLPYIKNLGINTILLDSIYPIDQLSKAEEEGYSYNAADTIKIDPKIGNTEDLFKLINLAHDFDMKLILDLDVNNPSDKSGMDPRSQEYIKSILYYWLNEYNIDGYRLNSADKFPLGFWAETISDIRKIKQDIIMISDSDDPYHSISGFDLISDKNLIGIIEKIQKGYYQIDEMSNYIHTQYQLYPQNSKRMLSIDNEHSIQPDKVSANQYFLPHHLIKFFIPGVPLIINNSNIQTDNNKENYLIDFYKDMISLRKKAKPLNSHSLDSFSFNKGLYYYEIIRSSFDKTVHAIFNIDNNSITILNNGRMYKTINNIA